MNPTFLDINWSSFVEAISASVAILCKKDNELVVLAANHRFLLMLGRENDSIQLPINAKELFPRYVFRSVLNDISKCISKSEPIELEQAFDVHSITHWWRLHLKPIFEQENQVDHAVMLTGLDMTSRITLENELKSSHSRLSSLIDSAYDGVVSVDQKQKITLFNNAAEDIFGYNKDEILGKSLTRLIPERFRHNHDQHLDFFAKSPIHSRQMLERDVILGMRKDGSEFPVEVAISKIFVNGLLEFTAVIRDITERSRLLDELKERATTDYLTGLKNRLYFTERSTELISLSKRHQRTFSLVMIDIDDFKQINDRYGHAKGDEVLKAFADSFSKILRESDIGARIGGEEFVLLLAETEITGALVIAERLRKTIEQGNLSYQWVLEAIPFTVSIGVTEFQMDDDDNIDKLLKRADEALYRAKYNGKNQVDSDSTQIR